MQNIFIVILFLFVISFLIIKKIENINKAILSLISFYMLVILALLIINPREVKNFLRKEIKTYNATISLIEKETRKEKRIEKQEVKKESINVEKKVLLDAPVIKQFPELPRGCEVTSLAMFLQYFDVKTDKMELAKKIKKNKTPRTRKNGETFWGNPNDGYIGNMYTYDKPGYGVYHKPIIELAENYLPKKIVNLTGSKFEDLKLFLSNDRPVWIIINTTFKKLPNSAFEKWNTPNGEVKITYKEHSVLITGYDESFIYFNDPISGEKNKKVPTANFIKAWEQMGNQAFSFKLN